MLTVEELIEILQDYDPEANVYIASQPAWPFEHSIEGVISREEYDGDWSPNLTPDSPDAADEDGLLLEGRQIRYGDKAAWEGLIIR